MKKNYLWLPAKICVPNRNTVFSRYFKWPLFWALIFAVLFPGAGRTGDSVPRCGADLLSPLKPIWPPKGQSVKCPVTRDTLISAVGNEKIGNNGRLQRLKVKGQQEYILFDMDPISLKGRIIKGAVIHFRSTSPGDAPLARLGISTVASKWVEGTSKYYKPEKGSACFSQAEYKIRDWAYPGSSILDVVFGKGNTIWKFADCSRPDSEGWQRFAVDADVVAARIADLSHGFLVWDEIGSEWSCKDGKFKYRWFPNRFCHGKESKGSEPWLEVWADGKDLIPPDKIQAIQVIIEDFPPGEALVSWKTPKDSGGGKTLGFQISYQKGNMKKMMPRYLIPMAGRPGEEVRMHIRDLPFQPGALIEISIRPVDSAGNIGQALTQMIELSGNLRHIELPEADITPFPPSETLPTVSGIKVSVLDLLDKVDPRSGKIIPPAEEGYRGGNHIYSARKRFIRLYSARNETVAFQLNLEGKADDIDIRYTFDQSPQLRPKIFQFAYVNARNKKGKSVASLPDPLIPLNGTFPIPSMTGKVRVPNQMNHSLICEVYVPHDQSPGKKKGKLIISAGKETMAFDIDLTIWNFTLPNKLSFIPEMNAYWTSYPARLQDYYRLAHEHRTCLNWLTYGWHGKPAFAPGWKGKNFDWSVWDQKAGPLLDGSAFADLPRKGEPVDVFYLPLSENWPVELYDHYRPSFWADEAFTEEYKRNLKTAFASFAKHCDEKKWHDTIFQFYLNNKIYYREKFPRSSAPWIFDEPVNTQDFWALRWYGLLWKSATTQVKGNARMWFRGDISFSHFSRNMLWGIMDLEYLGGNNSQKTRMKRDEQILFGRSHFSEYGTANKINNSNAFPAFWCLSAWYCGAEGVLPWQTIGGKNSWDTAEQTALFYPHPKGPYPSVRLKAFRRGQQDVEYLSLFCDTYNTSRFGISGWLEKMLPPLKEFYQGANKELQEHVNPEMLWRIRYHVGKMMSDKAPVFKRSLLAGKKRNAVKRPLPDIGYVAVSPQFERLKPDCISFRPREVKP